eukprot:21176-Eustigmatos_ZCMA.PRE.1
MSRCDLIKTRPLTSKLDGFGNPIPMSMNDCREMVIEKVLSSRSNDTDCDISLASIVTPQCLQSTLEDRE